MPKYQIDRAWYDAPNYAAARARSLADRPPAPVVVAPIAPHVVPTITPVLTPAANFGGRSTVRFGVGERIALGFTTTPLGLAAASFGGLTWVVASDPRRLSTTTGTRGLGC